MTADPTALRPTSTMPPAKAPQAGATPPGGTAPAAPGRLGEAIAPEDLLPYLDDLGRWRVQRRSELDRLDAAALQAATPDAFTGDVVLAMSLWQAVSARLDQMTKVWDSGRVGRAEREELSRLIWGRLDATGAGVAVSLVEASRLCDALTGALRARLSLDPLASGLAERVASLRAALERCREMVAESRSAAAARARQAAQDAAAAAASATPVDEKALADLRADVDDLADRAGRGADVAGPFAALEARIARAERDLIVAAATRRDLVRDGERARTLVRELGERAVALEALARVCADKIAAPPRLAVPDVAVLGPVPGDRVGLDAFLGRLDRVAAATAMAEKAYAAPLAERDDLRGMLGGYQAMAVSNGRGERPDIVTAYAAAHDVLWTSPCDLVRARALVTRYQGLVRGEIE